LLVLVVLQKERYYNNIIINDHEISLGYDWGVAGYPLPAFFTFFPGVVEISNVPKRKSAKGF
jgi:hypothetical protein